MQDGVDGVPSGYAWDCVSRQPLPMIMLRLQLDLSAAALGEGQSALGEGQSAAVAIEHAEASVGPQC